MKNMMRVFGDVVDAIEGNDTINSAPTVEQTLQPIFNTVFLVVGIVAVIMIIVGGITYTTSQGDPSKTKKAKDTIMYGIIGLVIALLAFAIVSFALGGLSGGGEAQ